MAAVQFTTTRWSLVFSAANPDSHVAREQFARLYAYPLYAFARREGLAVPDAEDAVQGGLSRLMVGDRLGGVRPEGGRFRSYLLAGFRNFLVSQHRHDVAQSRRPGATSPRCAFRCTFPTMATASLGSTFRRKRRNW